jgi:hypothetical protein
MIGIYFIIGTILILIGYIVGLRDKEFKSFGTFISNHSLFFRILISTIFILLLYFNAVYIQNTVGKQKFDTAEFWKYVIGGLVVIGLIYTILTFEFTVKQSREAKRTQQSQSTFGILSAWYNSPLIDYSKVVDQFEKTANYQLLKNNLDDFIVFYDDLSQSIELRNAVRGVFNFFEMIGSGIREGVIDEGFVRRYFEEVFILYYDDWIEFIKKRRQNAPEMFIEFTNLAEKWKNNP